jgi:hypothetical protein
MAVVVYDGITCYYLQLCFVADYEAVCYAQDLDGLCWEHGTFTCLVSSESRGLSGRFALTSSQVISVRIQSLVLQCIAARDPKII